jgi:hypothetical protein
MNHVAPVVMPAPVVYDVLAELKGLGHLLPEALDKISVGLHRSLSEFDIREHDGGDSGERNALSRAHLAQAAKLARLMGDELEAAQAAISQQGYRQGQA